MSEISLKLEQSMKVGGVICGGDKNKRTCARVKEKGRGPLFISVVVDGHEVFFEGKPWPSKPKPKELYDFAVQNMPRDVVKDVNRASDVVPKLLGGGRRRAVVLLTDKFDVSSMYLGLAYKHSKDAGRKLSFGVSRGSR